MLLSIIIPVYNTAQYLERCLDSCLQQGLKVEDYEIICINDGSTDNSQEIIDKYQKQNPNITAIVQENKGQAIARNVGIDKAKGQYLFFVDSDDALTLFSLSSCLQEATNNDLDILTHSFTDNYQNQLPQNYNVSSTTSGIDYVANYNFNNSACGYLIAREFLLNNQLRFTPGRYCEDGLFTLSCIIRAERIAHIDIPVYAYILRPGSTVTNRSVTHIEKTISDYLFAARYYNEEINVVKERLQKKALTRLLSRRDSYTFFGLMRLVYYCSSANLTFKQAQSTLLKEIEQLRAEGLYPLQHFISTDYTAWRFKLLTFILNHKIAVLIAMAILFTKGRLKHEH